MRNGIRFVYSILFRNTFWTSNLVLSLFLHLCFFFDFCFDFIDEDDYIIGALLNNEISYSKRHVQFVIIYFASFLPYFYITDSILIFILNLFLLFLTVRTQEYIEVQIRIFFYKVFYLNFCLAFGIFKLIATFKWSFFSLQSICFII